jgi:hypothetical protein
MKFKVNIKARLERHARNSHVFQKNKLLKIVTTFKVLCACLLILLPIYPSFGAYNGVTESTVGDYDESSILVAYEDTGDGGDEFLSDETGFLKPGVNLGSSRDTK